MESAPDESPREGRLREVALLFLRLGFTAFGGPAAHVAMMEREVVRRRNWLDRQHFLDLVAALNFIPGPNSTELAINLGLIRAGFAGLVVAGACFIVPAVLLILPLAWAYVTFGSLPAVRGAMQGVSAAVVAVVAVAGVRFFRTGVRDAFGLTVAALAAAAEALLRYGPGRRFPHLQVELLVMAASAAAGVLYYGRPCLRRALNLPLMALPPLPLLLEAGPSAASAIAADGSRAGELARLALFFLKVGATLFGSGYVLSSYLQGGLVEQHHWFLPQQLLDSIAVGQVTPGPLLTTATFVGYVRGYAIYHTTAGAVAGALASTAANFLPAFAFVAAFGPLLPRVRNNRYARAALDGMNAAVVALIFVAAARFACDLWPGKLRMALAAGSLAVLLRWNVNATWVMVACAAVGRAAG